MIKIYGYTLYAGYKKNVSSKIKREMSLKKLDFCIDRNTVYFKEMIYFRNLKSCNSRSILFFQKPGIIPEINDFKTSEHYICTFRFLRRKGGACSIGKYLKIKKIQLKSMELHTLYAGFYGTYSIIENSTVINNWFLFRNNIFSIFNADLFFVNTENISLMITYLDYLFYTTLVKYSSKNNFFFFDKFLSLSYYKDSNFSEYI